MTPQIKARTAGLAVAVVGILLLAAGCGGSGEAGIPSESDAPSGIAGPGLSATITHSTGPVAPPYNYQWVVTLDPSLSGSYTLTVNAAAGSVWSGAFTVDEDQRDRFASTMSDLGLTEVPDQSNDGLVGGQSGGYRIVTGDGRVFEGSLGSNPQTRALQEQVDAAAQALVPPDVWSKVNNDYQAWVKTQTG